MILKSKTLAVVLVVIMLVGIFGSSALGWWQTTSSKLPASYAEGEFAGQANPADIRGSYTFGDISQAFPVTPEILAQAFGVGAEGSASFLVKDLESLYAGSAQEIGTASVRLFVAFYAGLPFDLVTAAETYLPQRAVDLLLEKGNLSAEQLDFLKTHTADAGAIPPAPDTASQATPAPEATVAPGTVPPATVDPGPTTAAAAESLLIKGKTTFAELIGWGLQQSVIEQLIGATMPDPAMKVKDYATANALDFETLKSALQAELDKGKK